MRKSRAKCSWLTLLAAALLIGGMLAIILPVLKWDAEVSAEAGEYEQLREQKRQADENVSEEMLNQHNVPPISAMQENPSVAFPEKTAGKQAA